MNKMTTRAALLAAAFIVSIPLGLMAQDEGFYPYSFARLSYVNGDVYIQRTSDLGYEKGEVNLALVQGDKMGTENGQAEIHFGRRNYLRLDNRTKVEFAVLPSEGDERIRLHLTEGSAFLRISQLALDKGVEVHTPDASFYVLEEGLYRFDVRLDRETQVSVREGSLEAASEGGSVLVGYQETVIASEGRLLGEPQYAYALDDAFDGWNDSRDSQLSARSESRYLPSEMEEYEEELDQNGQWVYERPYGHVWVPNVSTYDAWRPYYYGRWVWYPVIGWTWVSSEPWGWSVYHYGRWNWRFGLGWYWIPRAHWGPAWVHWWWDRAYIGWCPLTWHNRPAYLFNDRFYDRYDDRWFSARNWAWTVVRRDHLQARDIGRRHLGVADLDRIGRVELRPQQPAIRPAVDNARPQAVAARRVLADRPGGRDQVRTVAPSRSLASPRSRPGASTPAVRTRDTGASGARIDSGAVSRPSLRGGGADNRVIRSYPSQRAPGSRGQSGIAEDRRSVVSAPGKNSPSTVRSGAGTEGRTTASTARTIRSTGSSMSRPATVRETPGARGSGTGSGSPVTRGGETVKSYPSTVRSSAGTAGRTTASTARSVRSTPARAADASAGRSQSRTYAPSSSIAGQTSRLSPRAATSARPSPSVTRPAASSSRSISARAPASSRPSVSSSRSRASSTSSSARLRATSPSSGSRARSYSSPSRSTQPSRSISAPRSTRSSAPRSMSAPRSSRSSSARASGSVRSGGSSSSRSSSSGRAKASSSRSSASSSRSGGAKRK